MIRNVLKASIITLLETWKISADLNNNAFKSYKGVTLTAMASLDKLKGRRVGACQRFIINVRQHPPLMSIDPPPPPTCNPRPVGLIDYCQHIV